MSKTNYHYDTNTKKIRLKIEGKSFSMPVEVDKNFWDQQTQTVKSDYPNAFAINAFLNLTRNYVQNMFFAFGVEGIDKAFDSIRTKDLSQYGKIELFNPDMRIKNKAFHNKRLRYWFTEFVRQPIGIEMISWECKVNGWRADALVKAGDYYYEYEFKNSKQDYNLDFSKKYKDPESGRMLLKHQQIINGKGTNCFYYVLNHDRVRLKSIEMVDYAGYIIYSDRNGKYDFTVIKQAPLLTPTAGIDPKQIEPYTEYETDKKEALKFYDNYADEQKRIANDIFSSLHINFK